MLEQCGRELGCGQHSSGSGAVDSQLQRWMVGFLLQQNRDKRTLMPCPCQDEGGVSTLNY